MTIFTRLGLSRQRRQQLIAAALLAGASFIQPAAAQVAGTQQHFTAVGPVDPQTLFPTYYQDGKGDTLQLCTANNDILGLCLFAPPTTLIDNFPLQQQTGFADEAFYADANKVFTIDMPGNPGGGRGLILMSLEAAYFTGPPIVGDEFVFTRLRFFIDAPVAGKYRITHPFGVEDVTVTAPGTRAINITKDIGSQSPDFTGPLRGNVGAFLKWDPAIAPAAPPGYVGDPNVEHEFVGATYTRPGDTAPFNKVRFEYLGPLPGDANGVPQALLDLGAGPGQPLEFSQIVVTGQYYTGVPPAPLSAVRTTYSNGRTEIFAESAPDSTVTVSFDGGATSTPMVGDANGNFYLVQNSATMPTLAQLKAVEPGHTDTTINATVTDAVYITSAQFDPATHSLAVTALTGITPAPTLNVIAFGQQSLGTMVAGDPASTTGTTQMTFSATGLPVGPATIEVQSSAGGVATQQVQYLNPSDVGTTTTPPPVQTAPGPVANNDTAQIPVLTPFVINVAQNDAPQPNTTLNLNSIKVVSPPTLGTIGLIGPAGITYTPGPNLPADGGVTTDSFTYTIADSAGNVSNPATVTVSAIPATLQPTLIQYTRSKIDWRVRANTSAPANSSVRATLVERDPVTRAVTAQTLIGSGLVTAGTVDIRATGSPVLSNTCINNAATVLCSVTLDDDFGKVTAGNAITIK